MEIQGNRAPPSPYNSKAMLSSLLNKKSKLQQELNNVEKQVYELETSYLQETSHFGNAFKGFEGFLSSSKNTSNLKRSKKFQLEDRIFSLSSVTSPATEELVTGREGPDGISDPSQSRPRSGNITINGQGRPKKGRHGHRDGKKIRLLSSDVNIDEDDD